MKKQEIFNKVAKHLLKQGEKSTNGAGDCAYRGLNGLSCAVGCLLDDETATKGDSLPDSAIDDLIAAGLISGDLKRNKSILASLQKLHDNNDPSDWRDLLESLAARNHLTMPLVSEIHPNCK